MIDPQSSLRRSWLKKLGWSSTRDAVVAFQAVGREIRARCQSVDPATLTLGEACQLARRVKEQRDLVHQIMDRRHYKHARRLLRLNQRLKARVLKLAEQAGLDAGVLLFR